MSEPDTVPPEQAQPELAPSRGATGFGILAAPAAYAVVALVNYIVAPAVCQAGMSGSTVLKVVTFLVTAAGLLVALWAGYTAYRNVQGARAAGASSDDSRRFISVGGIMLSVLFSALIIIAGLSGLAMRPCEPV
jgi:hypothetical protein